MKNNLLSVIRRPSLALLGSEPLRAAIEYAQLKLRRRLAGAPPGDGHPVVIFPGLASDRLATAPLRKYCTALGYEAMDWGRGLNTGPQGPVDRWLERLAHDVDTLLGARAQSATLIGWSLGGLYARELAKLMGSRVRQVITIGTPFNTNADADHTHVGWLFRLLNGNGNGNGSGNRNGPALTTQWSARLRLPPAVPTTSIYSRSDGIVAWQTCRHDGPYPQAQDVEVASSHLGMGWNRDVLRVVADRLAQVPGQWTRYRPDRADVAPRASAGMA